MIEERLYQQIRQVMPIPCVDVLVTDENGRVLLLKRANRPAAGQWWFPGGRVHFLEKRMDAVSRKLKEECCLTMTHADSMGTFDMIFTEREGRTGHHGITTLFHTRVRRTQVTLDRQSQQYAWRTIAEWKTEPLHPFVRNGLNCYYDKKSWTN